MLHSHSENQSDAVIAEVIVDISASSVDRIFDYILPEGVQKGMRVLVPFGTKQIEGYVINIKDKSNYDETKLKHIIKALDNFVAIKPEMIELMRFMQQEYKLKIVDVLRLFIPAQMRGGKVKDLTFIYLKQKNLDITQKLTKTQDEFLRTFIDFPLQKLSDIKVSSVVINTLIKYGAIEKIQVKHNREPATMDVNNKKIVLTKPQEQAIKTITDSKADVFVLHGVTGSGKTEVYMRLIADALNKQKTAIMLVPEISLTPQMFGHFKNRFGKQVAILHSGLSAGERYDEWRRLESGEAKIAIGARSAIFAPVTNIGIIIIDEEHDGSYFSETNPRYFTHTVATFRAKQNNCNLILGSATPSIDTYYKTQTGEYKLLEILKRVNNTEMPKIQLVDMCKELREGNGSMFSREFSAELDKCVENKNQAMIFLNRRGFSSSVICKQCGWVAKCKDCDVSLVYHKEDGVYKCHYCNKHYKLLAACPECNSTYLKFGAIGTEKVCEELKKRYGEGVEVIRMDNDTTQNKDSLINILDRFSKAKPAILVGTQMIAKGHHFPSVTLVGIIDADVSLHFSDFRAAERTFQLITQVSGRAGRDEFAGKVILQTYMPNHYAYRFAANYEYKGFFEKELNTRKVTKYPPFTTIARLLFTGERDDILQAEVKSVIDKIKNQNLPFIFIGAAKCPLKRLQNKFRYQILMRFDCKESEKILQYLYKVFDEINNKNVYSFFEINPQNLS